MEESDSSQWRDFASNSGNSFHFASVQSAAFNMASQIWHFLLMVIQMTHAEWHLVQMCAVSEDCCVHMRVWCKIFFSHECVLSNQSFMKNNEQVLCISRCLMGTAETLKPVGCGTPVCLFTGLDPVVFYTCLAKSCDPLRVLNTEFPSIFLGG